MNIDGAVFSKRKQVGARVIIRNGEGEMIAALCKRWQYPLGAIEAEAKAWKTGILFARDVGIRDVVFKGGLVGGLQSITRPSLSSRLSSQRPHGCVDPSLTI